MTLNADVVVVGGGPAGSTVSFLLARRGMDVLLVDRARFPREKVCGESLSPGAIDRLSAIGLWSPPQDTDAAAASGAPFAVAGMEIHSPAGDSFVGRYRGAPARCGLIIRRTTFDATLLERAARAGVRVREGFEAVGAEVADERADIETRLVGGSATLRISARRLVVCDGRRSFLARQLGFLESMRPGAGMRFAVRAHCGGLESLGREAEMHIGHRGYCGVAPLGNGSANVCYVSYSRHLDLRPEELEAGFRRTVASYETLADRTRSMRVEGRVEAIGPLRLRGGRVCRGGAIACGDATGFLDPFTGEGMGRAIATGIKAASAISASVGGDRLAFDRYADEVRRLRWGKGTAARIVYSLVEHPRCASAITRLLRRSPRAADALVRFFGDQL